MTVATAINSGHGLSALACIGLLKTIILNNELSLTYLFYTEQRNSLSLIYLFLNKDKMLTTLPDITLSTTGGELNLSKLKAKYLVLYFYPKDDTPGCTLESQDFNRHYATLTKLGAVVYGVSRDKLASHDKFKDKFAFSFELISDADATLCDYFKVLTLKKNYGKEYLGIDRSSFLFKHGTLIKEWRTVKVDEHVVDIIKTIEADEKTGA